ncbi:MAG TPA: type II secretion system minor pseudopilin GspI [Caulobacteraceae bacterium]|nr:type II secretion system minor pseudopilin GspI [Caulobacteraceae bacterium]
MRRKGADSGFTLIEVLVALAVFSLAALTLVNLSGENARAAAALEARTMAAVVADNQAVRAVIDWPPIGITSGQEVAGDRPWFWVRRVSRTNDPEVARVDVLVSDRPGGSTLAEVTVFRGQR